MMEWISSPEAWIALATLASLEIILGVDNIVVLTIIVEKLPEHQRAKARFIGLALALILRVLLLLSITWVMGLTTDLFRVPYFDIGISGKDVILLLGGLFLLAKATKEIDQHIRHEEEEVPANVANSFLSAMVQIALLDVVFSLDSVITAVGMAEDLPVMIIAVLIAIICMMIFAGRIGRFVTEHPTVQMLALSFLLLIGITLIAEGLDLHFPKGYIYFAMGFSLFVQILNLKIRKPGAPQRKDVV
ncbi:MAG: TerC family protein [Verrucomicrobiales bacterium]|nr:TerC family protein [Verrucomicrobiales bacterium]